MGGQINYATTYRKAHRPRVLGLRGPLPQEERSKGESNRSRRYREMVARR